MATELAVQSERAFQKQPHIFLNHKAANIAKKSRRTGTGGRRWYKDVGLGFRTPALAINGTYIGRQSFQPWVDPISIDSIKFIDKKCPFTGEVSIRGRILTGTVVSTKMHRTLVVRREYLHFVPKYARYEKRHKNLAAHVSPAFRVEEGDQVTVGQCRPLSKTVCSHCTRMLSDENCGSADGTPCRFDSMFFVYFHALASRSSYSISSERQLLSAASI